MKRVFQAASLLVVLAVAFAGCAGRAQSNLPTPAVPASATSLPQAVERAPSGASVPVTASGGATCGGGAGSVAVPVLCAGPAGSKGTVNFSLDQLGPFGLAPTRCSDVTWQTTSQTFATAALARARAPHALGGPYYCDTSTSYSLSVTASGPVGSVTIAHAYATYTVCFDLPINPCAPSGIAGPTISIVTTAPGSGGGGGGGSGGGAGDGSGGGGSCGATVHSSPAKLTRPFTGVIGGGGGSPSPSPAPTAPPTIAPSPSPSPTGAPVPSPSPTTPPSCSPGAGSLPPPDSPKDRYTASRLAEVALPLTDAAGNDQGQLRWQVSGDSGTFENVRFDTDVTAGPPHANTLRLRVPFEIKSGDHQLHVHVTASTGKSSQDKTIVLSVVTPAAYETELNAQDVFEQDDAGNVIQADASRYTAGDDNVTPDFGIRIDVPGTAASSRGANRASSAGRSTP